jgi:hypothetical protein
MRTKLDLEFPRPSNLREDTCWCDPHGMRRTITGVFAGRADGSPPSNFAEADGVFVRFYASAAAKMRQHRADLRFFPTVPRSMIF